MSRINPSDTKIDRFITKRYQLEKVPGQVPTRHRKKKNQVVPKEIHGIRRNRKIPDWYRNPPSEAEYNPFDENEYKGYKK